MYDGIQWRGYPRGIFANLGSLFYTYISTGIISEPVLNIYYYIGDDDPEQKDPSSTNRPHRQNNNTLGFYGGRGELF